MKGFEGWDIEPLLQEYEWFDILLPPDGVVVGDGYCSLWSVLVALRYEGEEVNLNQNIKDEMRALIRNKTQAPIEVDVSGLKLRVREKTIKEIEDETLGCVDDYALFQLMADKYKVRLKVSRQGGFETAVFTPSSWNREVHIVTNNVHFNVVDEKGPVQRRSGLRSILNFYEDYIKQEDGNSNLVGVRSKVEAIKKFLNSEK